MKTKIELFDKNGKPKDFVVLEVMNGIVFESDSNELYSHGYTCLNACIAAYNPGVTKYIGFFQYMYSPPPIPKG